MLLERNLEKYVSLTARLLLAVFLSALLLSCRAPAEPKEAVDLLPSWNNGGSRQAILDFVARVTKEGGPEFVPREARIAVFDNDGTLWTEQPVATELAFSFDRVKELATQHPEWKTKQPFAALLKGDMKAVAASGERGINTLFMASHAGITTDQFSGVAGRWVTTTKHPKFQRPYSECVYQPMLELLDYLRANGFKTYIVSGGEVEFMRPWAEKVYGIPPEQVIGTMLKLQYDAKDPSALMRLPELLSFDDGPAKPANIGNVIGRRPIAAFGNSDGDLQMLEWTAAGPGPRLALLVHHTDAQREYSYDRGATIGKLDKALDEANAKHWVVVDMQNDWKTVFKARD